jgi:hypothetical protein
VHRQRLHHAVFSVTLLFKPQKPSFICLISFSQNNLALPFQGQNTQRTFLIDSYNLIVRLLTTRVLCRHFSQSHTASQISLSKKTHIQAMKVYCFFLPLFLLPGLDARLHNGGRNLVKPDDNEVTAFDCEAGCDLKKRQVCGDDGFTYYNECLAICQVRRPCCRSLRVVAYAF